MSIKVNLEFVKDSKELLDGIERLTRLIDGLEINNIEIFQEKGKTKAKVIYNNLDERYCQNYFTCFIHKGTLEHYFDIDFANGSIYENIGDFGFTTDQVLYLKYGNQNLYIVETDDVFTEVGSVFSETELRENFKEYWMSEYYYDSDDFEGWLKETVSNGYLKMYILFDVQRDSEYIDKFLESLNV